MGKKKSLAECEKLVSLQFLRIVLYLLCVAEKHTLHKHTVLDSFFSKQGRGVFSKINRNDLLNAGEVDSSSSFFFLITWYLLHSIDAPPWDLRESRHMACTFNR